MAKEGKDMEKKLSSKSCSTAPEAKGKEYNAKSNNNKRFHGKRRDAWPTEGHVPTRNQPPRNKAFDKRNGTKQNWSGRRDEVTKAQRAEFGSALPHGSKKINLNHLLNFKLEPRGHQNAGKVGYRGQWSTRNKWGSHRHNRYNKEQFLQANCQFVVKSSEDYTVNMHDPDAIVDWDLVEQVRLLGHEVPSCPICLYPPSAAQITRCGHIFCWSCILHYLALSDKHWRKCPICYESVMKKDLKSVVATEQPLYKPGDEITMCLMKRQRGSVISQPVYLGENLEDVTSPYNILEKRTKSCFVKLLTASPEEVKYLILSSERAALEKQMQENDDELEETFIQAAMDSLKEREDVLTGGTPSLLTEGKDPIPTAAAPLSPASEDDDEEVVVSAPPDDKDYFVYASAFSDEEADISTQDVEEAEEFDHADPTMTDEAPVFTEILDSPDASSKDPMSPAPPLAGASRTSTTSESTEGSLDSPLSPSPMKGPQSQKTHTYYFYQSEDGQPIFIHPLNVRCLVQEYGSLDKCPLTITAKVVEMEHSSMTEDVRHRLRYMVHLPLTCNFAVCELDLKPPVVSEETLHLFQDDFLRRKKARERKLKEEKRRERRLQTEMNKSYGVYPGSRYSLQSSRHFPNFGSVSDDQMTVSSGSSSPGQATPLSTSVEEGQAAFPQTTQSTGSAVAVSGPPSGVPSFAQMLREGQARPSLPRKIPSQNNPEPGAVPGKKGRESDESDSEDRVPVPQYQDAFSDAIQDALDKVSLNKKDGEIAAAVTTGRKGKKGRKKQQLLFSTAGPRFK